MAATTQPVPPVGGAQSVQPVAPSPAVDVQSVIDATHASLDAYLNQPVRDILARLGLAVPPDAAAPAADPAHTGGGPAPQGGSPGGGSPGGGGSPSGGGGSPMDPTQMIKPVTDALGTLGSGQYGGGTDPTQSLGGISQALDSAGSQVQQALSGVGSDWQGDAASAAQAKTQAALADGSKVSSQADALRENLATATAAVAQAQARLIQIIDEYWAKIAAIGPSIIFPWGIAAAIAAATQAVTETAEVMTETETILTTQAAGVTALGAPVSVADAPALGAGGAAGGAGALSPMMQLASTAVSPVMQAVSSAAGSAAGSGGTSADSATAASTPVAGTPVGGAAGGGHGAAGASRGVGGGALAAPSRLAAASSMAVPSHAEAPAQSVAKSVPAGGAGGAPMGGGGAGMANHGAKAGVTGGHNAADFLHTSDQGGEIVGDLGNVAPPVIGEKDPMATPTTGR